MIIEDNKQDKNKLYEVTCEIQDVKKYVEFK